MNEARRIRSFSRVPVLILTARVDAFDQIAELETSADDYVVKATTCGSKKQRRVTRAL